MHLTPNSFNNIEEYFNAIISLNYKSEKLNYIIQIKEEIEELETSLNNFNTEFNINDLLEDKDALINLINYSLPSNWKKSAVINFVSKLLHNDKDYLKLNNHLNEQLINISKLAKDLEKKLYYDYKLTKNADKISQFYLVTKNKNEYNSVDFTKNTNLITRNIINNYPDLYKEICIDYLKKEEDNIINYAKNDHQQIQLSAKQKIETRLKYLNNIIDNTISLSNKKEMNYSNQNLNEIIEDLTIAPDRSLRAIFLNNSLFKDHIAYIEKEEVLENNTVAYIQFNKLYNYYDLEELRIEYKNETKGMYYYNFIENKFEIDAIDDIYNLDIKDLIINIRKSFAKKFYMDKNDLPDEKELEFFAQKVIEYPELIFNKIIKIPTNKFKFNLRAYTNNDSIIEKLKTKNHKLVLETIDVPKYNSWAKILPNSIIKTKFEDKEISYTSRQDFILNKNNALNYSFYKFNKSEENLNKISESLLTLIQSKGYEKNIVSFDYMKEHFAIYEDRIVLKKAFINDIDIKDSELIEINKENVNNYQFNSLLNNRLFYNSKILTTEESSFALNLINGLEKLSKLDEMIFDKKLDINTSVYNYLMKEIGLADYIAYPINKSVIDSLEVNKDLEILIKQKAPFSERGVLTIKDIDPYNIELLLANLELAYGLSSRVSYNFIYPKNNYKGKVQLYHPNYYIEENDLNIDKNLAIIHGLTGTQELNSSYKRLEMILKYKSIKSTSERRRMKLNVHSMSPLGDIASGVDLGVPCKIGYQTSYGSYIYFIFKPEILALRDIWFSDRDYGGGKNRYDYYNQYSQMLGCKDFYSSPNFNFRTWHINTFSDLEHNEVWFKDELSLDYIDFILVQDYEDSSNYVKTLLNKYDYDFPVYSFKDKDNLNYELNQIIKNHRNK